MLSPGVLHPTLAACLAAGSCIKLCGALCFAECMKLASPFSADAFALGGGIAEGCWLQRLSLALWMLLEDSAL